MTEAIVTYLNAVIDTVGRVDARYCMAELRSDGVTTVPYSYVGTGNVQPIDIDGGSLSYWRMPEPIAFAQIEAQYGKPRLSGTYPLRLVIMARRKDSTVDDGFMPTRLAEDIANALAGSHPDLKLLLKANTVSIAVGSIDTNITSVWATEFIGTGVSDPNYTRVIMALTVSVTVVGDRACWENECDYDPDILHLFDFCKADVVARLTDAQVACLETALCVDPTLCELIALATASAIVDCLSPDQETAVQALVCTPCADATITVNTLPFGTATSGGAFNVPVKNSAGTNVGSDVAGEWLLSDSTLFVNNTDISVYTPAETDTNIGVTLDGVPVDAAALWNAGTQTLEVVSATDLRLRVYIATAGDTNFGTITIDAGSAGTITSVNAGGLTNLVISVNAVPVTAPFVLGIGDSLTGAFDAAAGTEVPELTGTY